MSRLGDTIHRARLNAGMTEKQLGRKSGMAESVIRDIESGRRIVSDEQAQRLLRLLGSESPISAELEVAAEPEVKPRPRPRAYIVPADVPPEQQKATDEATDAWLDALGGVVRRVPVMDEHGVALDHVLTPIIDGKIEGSPADKVLYFRMPDDSMRGYRVHAGDLLLTVPENRSRENCLLLLEYKGSRTVRKLQKLDGLRVQLLAFDREFAPLTIPANEVHILGRCVRLLRML